MNTAKPVRFLSQMYINKDEIKNEIKNKIKTNEVKDFIKRYCRANHLFVSTRQHERKRTIFLLKL